MDIKFTQLYFFDNTLYALDEYGQVWNFFDKELCWVEYPHAKRNVPEQKNTGNIVKPLTPDEIQDKAFKEAQDTVTSEIKEYGR